MIDMRDFSSRQLVVEGLASENESNKKRAID